MRGKAGQSADRAIDRQILELFRERGSVISGGELSRVLKVSRTAVWKHITGLRAQGYRIESLHASGYRLVESPDVLTSAAVTAGLAAGRLGRQVICLADTGSTNLEAYRLAEQGAPEGTLVLADTQNQGKGRLGRSWHSPPGVNLYCSLILRPSIPPVAAFQLTFLSAVAVARAIESEARLRPFIKWPNDILVNGKKAAGLLNEMSAEVDRVNFIVLGIGVNLNMRADQFPDDLRHPATSLFLETGETVNRLSFVRTLIETLDELYDRYLRDGYDPVRKEWLERSGMVGLRVAVDGTTERLEGVVMGIDDSGALLVDQAGGTVARVLAGDVRIL